MLPTSVCQACDGKGKYDSIGDRAVLCGRCDGWGILNSAYGGDFHDETFQLSLPKIAGEAILCVIRDQAAFAASAAAKIHLRFEHSSRPVSVAFPVSVDVVVKALGQSADQFHITRDDIRTVITPKGPEAFVNLMRLRNRRDHG